MIRMGRSSKTDTSKNMIEQPEKPANSDSTYQFAVNNQPPSRAATESETMARDIKEGRLSGFVGNGTVLTGETNFQTMLRIDGHLTGRITSESGTLVVGTTGKVDANITVATAVINGTINGDITAAEKIELGRTAKVVGNIQAARLLIEDGAILEGSCSMLKAKESFDKNSNKSNSFVSDYSKETNGHFELTEEAAETAQAAVN